MQEIRFAARQPSDRALDEASAFAWLRYYAALLLVAILAGAAIGGAIVQFRPSSAEAWTYVLQTPYRLPRGQLGLMSKAMFASPVVYQSVRAVLPVSESEEAFRRTVEVRPVPDTNTLIVVGRAADPAQAHDVSAAAARGLLLAFRQAGVRQFAILGTGPPATVSSVSDRVTIAATTVVALLVALAVALVHFGLVRPILSLDRAIAATQPSRVFEVPRRSAVLRIVGRERPELPDVPAGSTLLSSGGRSVRRTAERIASARAKPGRQDAAAVVVAGPATREPFLLRTRMAVRSSDDMTLVWVR